MKPNNNPIFQLGTGDYPAGIGWAAFDEGGFLNTSKTVIGDQNLRLFHLGPQPAHKFLSFTAPIWPPQALLVLTSDAKKRQTDLHNRRSVKHGQVQS